MTLQLAFDVHAVVRDDRLVLNVAGELDLASAPHLRAAVDDAWEAAPSALVLDLGAVTFCDSMGVSTLVYVLKGCRERGIRLALARVPLVAQRVLRITGLIGHFDRHGSVDEALAADADSWRFELA